MNHPTIDTFRPWWAEHHGKFDALLLDIDGTLSTGGHPLPGAVEMLTWLREQAFPFCLLTNDGNRSPMEKRALLAQAGIAVGEAEIISCGMGLECVARDPARRDGLYFVAGHLGEPSYADAAGLRTTRAPDAIKDCAGIIIGEGDYDWQSTLNAVFNALLADPGKQLIVPNPDSYWPQGPDGEIGIGSGGKARFLVALLADAGIAIKPDYLGKPHRPIFDLALEHLRTLYAMPEIPRERVLMLGDSLGSDIRGANNAGLVSGLLLSGITGRDRAAAAQADQRPRWIFTSL